MTAIASWTGLCRRCSGMFYNHLVRLSTISKPLPHCSLFPQYRYRLVVQTSNAWKRNASSVVKLPKRLARKKALVKKEQYGNYKATAYATANEYDLEGFMAYVEEEGLYSNGVLPEDLLDAKFLTTNYMIDPEPRNIVVFRRGTVVFWNVPSEEQSNFLRSLVPYEIDPYDKSLVRDECETLEYIHAEEDEKVNKTSLRHDLLRFAPSEDIVLEKYVFSDGLTESVQLAIWEACLAEYIDTIEEVTEHLRRGGRLQLSRKEVLQKTGELFNLSHLINLSSDLLDTPDFYWDRDELEKLYMQSRTYFNIRIRTKVMNNKLSHCMDLVDLLRDHLNTQHEVRLEWMIIILILVEVMFEVIHVIERKMGGTDTKVTPIDE